MKYNDQTLDALFISLHNANTKLNYTIENITNEISNTLKEIQEDNERQDENLDYIHEMLFILWVRYFGIEQETIH